MRSSSTLGRADAEVKVSERNRTLRLSPAEAARLAGRCVGKADLADRPLAPGMLAVGDAVDLLAHVPDASVDLVFADPPYNLDKRFGTHAGRAMSLDAYEAWVRTWIEPLRRVLKPHGSLYVCGDWRSSTALHRVLDQHFVVRNRITWEREKGRGARSNWKNASEDVWFATVGDEYTFDADAVLVMRANGNVLGYLPAHTDVARKLSVGWRFRTVVAGTYRLRDDSRLGVHLDIESIPPGS